MEKLVLFRDRQELTPDDFNAIQSITRMSIDRLIASAVTDENKYVGLDTTAATVTSVNVAAGAYFKGGKVYAVPTITPFNLYENLPVEQKRYVSIVVTGLDDQADQVEERDFLVDADSNDVEPQAVAMRSIRLGTVSKLVGTESVDPQPAVVPSGAILVAKILMNTAGISVITMEESTKLPSLKKHAERLTDLDNFRGRAEHRIGGLTTQLAALADTTRTKADISTMIPVILDVARMKDLDGIPDDYYAYGADLFLDADETDSSTAATHTILDNGLTFESTVDNKALSLLVPADPLVKVYDTDWITPAQSQVLALEIPGQSGEITMSSYQSGSIDTQPASSYYYEEPASEWTRHVGNVANPTDVASIARYMQDLQDKYGALATAPSYTGTRPNWVETGTLAFNSFENAQVAAQTGNPNAFVYYTRRV